MPEFKQINIDLLDPNPWQVRQNLGDDEGLIASIKDSPLKIRNAPLVRPNKARFQIASGHRRVNAAKKAGEKTIWCKVEKLSDTDMMREVLVENAHRRNLSPYELHSGFEQYRKALGLTKDFYSELSRQTGLGTDWISTIYDAKNIEPKLKIRVHENGEKNESKVAVSIIAETQGLQEKDRIALVEKAVDKGWEYRNVREVKTAVKDVPEKIRTNLIESEMDAQSTVNVALSIKPLDESVSIKILEGKTTPEQKIAISESLKPLSKEAQIKVVESKLSAPVMAELARLKVPDKIAVVAGEIHLKRLNDTDAITTINNAVMGIKPQTKEDILPDRDSLIETAKKQLMNDPEFIRQAYHELTTKERLEQETPEGQNIRHTKDVDRYEEVILGTFYKIRGWGVTMMTAMGPEEWNKYRWCIQEIYNWAGWLLKLDPQKTTQPLPPPTTKMIDVSRIVDVEYQIIESEKE